MNDYTYTARYADKIQVDNINDTLRSLIYWRKSMNDELSCLIYIKSRLLLIDKAKEGLDELSEEKLMKIIEKLESLCNKEIEFLSQTISTLQSIANANHSSLNKANPLLLKNIESVRNNYNKITSNIDKLIKSSLIFLELKQDYIHKHNPYANQAQSNNNEKVKDNSNIKQVSESIEKENLKSKTTLIREVNKELEHLNTLSVSSSISLLGKGMKNKSSNDHTVNDLKKELNDKPISSAIMTPIQSPLSLEEVINQFAESLKLTNYRPKNYLKPCLNKLLKKPKQIAHSNSTNNIIKSNSIELKDNIAIIEKMKIHLEELNNKIKEGCLMQKEKANYEKIKQENIQLNNELDYLKNCIGDVFTQYKSIIKQMTNLEEEQLQLKSNNKKLIDYIQAKSSANKSNEILMSLGMNSLSSIDMMNNINKNIERKTHYII